MQSKLRYVPGEMVQQELVSSQLTIWASLTLSPNTANTSK